MVALLYGCGLRRGRLRRSTSPTMIGRRGAAVLGGKGKKDRITYAAGGMADAIDSWVQPEASRKDPCCIRSTKAM